MQTQNENGRTLLETLSVIAVIGILSVTGIQLFSKSMVQIRTNDIINESFKLFSTRKEKASAKKRFDLEMAQTRTPYGYGLLLEQRNCGGDSFVVSAGAIRQGDRAIEEKVCRRIFQSMGIENFPIKDIYQYNSSCNGLNINDCSNPQKTSAMTFEFTKKPVTKCCYP